MPLNKKGKKIKAKFVEQYGPKGEGYFYGAERKGTVKNVTKEAPRKKKKR